MTESVRHTASVQSAGVIDIWLKSSKKVVQLAKVSAWANQECRTPQPLLSNVSLLCCKGCWIFVLIQLMAFTGIVLQVVESLYGQDLDSGHHGSGFPLPPFRQTMLEHHLTQAAQDKGQKDPGSAAAAAQRLFTDKETAYSKHAWNINNLPRCKVRLTCPTGRCVMGTPTPKGCRSCLAHGLFVQFVEVLNSLCLSIRA